MGKNYQISFQYWIHRRWHVQDLTNGGKLKVSRGRMSAVWSRGRSPDRGTGERSPPKPPEVKIGKIVRQKTIGRQNDRLWKIIGRKTFLRKIIGWQKKILGRKLKDRCKKDHWTRKYFLLKTIGWRTFRRKTIGRQKRVFSGSHC